MASKPSSRGSRDETEVPELNLTPIMNLIIILIPALLLSAAFVQIAVINVSAPQIGSGIAEEQPDEPEEKKLNLSVNITDRGFIVAGTGAVVGGAEGGEEAGPTVPKSGDDYDYEGLTKKLLEIKDLFPDETKVTLNAEPDIKYKILVGVMDASREAEGRELFPDVVLSAGIQ